MTRTKGAKDKKPRDTEYLKVSLEKARANSPITQDQNRQFEEGYNAKFVKFMGEIAAPGRPGPHDVELMNKRFMHYLDKCVEYDMKISNQAAYLAIGINQDDVRNWISGGNSSKEAIAFVKKVKQFCGVYREGLMINGKINPVTGIFWQKNYDGLRDQTDIVHTSTVVKEEVDTAKLKQKYMDATYTETDMSLPEPKKNGDK